MSSMNEMRTSAMLALLFDLQCYLRHFTGIVKVFITRTLQNIS